MKIHLIIVLSFLLLAACESQKKVETEKPATGMKAEATGIRVTNQWIRVGAKGMNTAAFFTITNNSNVNDTLISASSGIAELVEVHETFMKDNDMIGMRRIEHVVVPANGSVELKPRNLHIMFIKLNRDLKIGDTINLALNFKQYGELKFSAEVKEMDSQKMMDQ